MLNVRILGDEFTNPHILIRISGGRAGKFWKVADETSLLGGVPLAIDVSPFVEEGSILLRVHAWDLLSSGADCEIVLGRMSSGDGLCLRVDNDLSSMKRLVWMVG